ncbi:hypothetical protein [Streptomyces sp. NPDC001985]|uniref:hypothetical protein n=1 Tax=Streptomyces sp. NPDC001985 TaxID=3154406 RepID=UPI00331F763D
MKPLTRLRSSAAVWIAPVCLGIVIFYFFSAVRADAAYADMVAGPKWAPTVVEESISYFYMFAYPVAAGLGAWEAGRLKRDGVWALAPARSRHVIAVHTLLPGVITGWLMLLLPTLLGLVDIGVVPSLAALNPLLMAMALVVAHTVIGFAAGSWVNRVISAPALTLGLFYLVGWSATNEPAWQRHLSGKVAGGVMAGESLPWSTLAPPVLFAGSVAAALALAWIPVRVPWRRAVLWTTAALGAVAVMAGSLSTVRGWNPYFAPRAAGQVPVSCAGEAPRVCIPTGTGTDPAEVRKEIRDAFRRLERAGVETRMPHTIHDASGGGRVKRETTRLTWRMAVVEQWRRGGGPLLRMSVALQEVRFPCRSTDQVNSRSARLWATTVAGAGEPYLDWQRQELRQFENPDEIMRVMKGRVEEARKLPADRQAAWYERELARACTNAGKDIRS